MFKTVIFFKYANNLCRWVWSLGQLKSKHLLTKRLCIFVRVFISVVAHLFERYF